MSAIRIASRYAKSLLEQALQNNSLDAVYDDVKGMRSSIKNSRELYTLLKSPIVKSEKKENILTNVFGGKVNPLSSSFLSAVVNKKREAYLIDIFDAFESQYNKHHKIISAKITSAVEIDSNILAEVKKIVKENTGFDNIQLEKTIDPSLIGGFVLQFEDKLYDCSVKRKLDKLKKSFSS